MQLAVRIDDLPEGALDAAELFHCTWRARLDAALADADELAIILPPATHQHGDWRKAAARDLARAHTPKRVNIVVGEDQPAISAVLAYLEKAPGVTGQVLSVDGIGAGNPAQ